MDATRNVYFAFESPSFDPTGDDSDDYDCAAQQKYIEDYLQKTEDAIFGESGEPYTDYLDAQSFANFWLIQQFSRNIDGINGTDCYLYKNRGGKLVMGPLWDFDLAYNNRKAVLTLSDALDGARHGSNVRTENSASLDTPSAGLDDRKDPWFEALRQDPAFFKLLKQRWKVLDKLIANVCAEGDLLDQYKEQMATSWEYDHKLWGDVYTAYGMGSKGTYEEDIDSLRTWLGKRREWFDEHIGEMNRVEITLTFVADGKQVATQTQRCGSLDSPEPPQAPEKEGYEFEGWYIGDSALFEVAAQGNLMSDTTVEAHYRKL